MTAERRTSTSRTRGLFTPTGSLTALNRAERRRARGVPGAPAGCRRRGRDDARSRRSASRADQGAPRRQRPGREVLGLTTRSKDAREVRPAPRAPRATWATRRTRAGFDLPRTPRMAPAGGATSAGALFEEAGRARRSEADARRPGRGERTLVFVRPLEQASETPCARFDPTPHDLRAHTEHGASRSRPAAGSRPAATRCSTTTGAVGARARQARRAGDHRDHDRHLLTDNGVHMQLVARRRDDAFRDDDSSWEGACRTPADAAGPARSAQATVSNAIVSPSDWQPPPRWARGRRREQGKYADQLEGGHTAGDRTYKARFDPATTGCRYLTRAPSRQESRQGSTASRVGGTDVLAVDAVRQLRNRLHGATRSSRALMQSRLSS